MSIREFWDENCLFCATEFIENVVADGFYMREEIYDYLSWPDPDEKDMFIDALEFYAVTNFMAYKLQRKGEKVIEDFLGLPPIWARTTSGQMVVMDSVIQEIYNENV